MKETFTQRQIIFGGFLISILAGIWLWLLEIFIDDFFSGRSLVALIVMIIIFFFLWKWFIGKSFFILNQKEVKMKRKSKNQKSMSKCCNNGSCGGALYGLGFIGALIYYVSTASGFWMGVLGVLKAIVWPVFLIYSLMKSLGM